MCDARAAVAADAERSDDWWLIIAVVIVLAVTVFLALSLRHQWLRCEGDARIMGHGDGIVCVEGADDEVG